MLYDIAMGQIITCPTT